MQHNQHGEQNTDNNHYLRLAAMIVVSFISMYVMMYAMVNTPGDIYNSLNQVYMAGLMTAPMVVIELLLMVGMYKNKKLNTLLIAASCVAGMVCFLLIRQQTAISDGQFLRSMIPHHSGAGLMCEDAAIQDPRIKDLCKTIISGQRSEIEQMRRLLQEKSSAR